MSRAFRDAFTRLLCASLFNNRQERLQSIAAPLLGKQCVVVTNNIEFKTANAETTIHASSVIIKSASNDIPMTMLTPQNNHDLKTNITGSGEKARVSFSDEVNQLSDMKQTDI